MKYGETKIYHVPVLLSEIMSFLAVKRGNWYIDATVGDGGYTQKILQSGGRVLAIDQDEGSLKRTKERLREFVSTGQLKIKLGNFRHLQNFLKEANLGEISGIVFDLGMSTYQLKESQRGFSFKTWEKLDMRMSVENTLTAANIVNTYDKEDLYEIFRTFGEEHLAGAIADALIRARTLNPISDAMSLHQLVSDVYLKFGIKEKKDPATRVFQALRIAVNHELDVLEEVLPQSVNCLAKGGILAIVSFHSLEDRLAKLFMKQEKIAGRGFLVTAKPIIPGEKEIQSNPAARSAKLRVMQKL